MTLRRATALIVTAVVAAGLAVVATISGHQRPAPRRSAAPTGLFPASPFDQPAPSLRPVPARQGEVATIVEQYHQHYGGVGVNEMPIFTVVADQKPVTVAVTKGCNDFQPATGRIPIPTGAYTTDPAYQHDSSLIVRQPATGLAWELWRAARNPDGSWSACWGGRLSTATSSGTFPGSTGLSATGISYLATMVTEADVARSAIDHTLALDITGCHGHVTPAVRDDCKGSDGEPPEGAWLKLPASVPMPTGLTRFGQMVFRALQRHGAVVTDQAGAVMLQAETRKDWTAEGHAGVDPITASWQGHPQYSALDGIPWSQLQVVAFSR